MAERGTPCATPVSLNAYRQRRLAERSAAARPSAPEPVKPAYLGAEAGKVIVSFTNDSGLELSPEHARIWAERLAAMADVAEALAKEGGGDAG